MPFEGPLNQRRHTLAPEPKVPTWAETAAAAFGLENATVALMREVTEPDFAPDPEFRVMDHLTDDEVQSSPSLAWAQSTDELNQIRGRLERERANRRILDEAGVSGAIAQMGAAIVDPVTWPAGGIAGRAVVGGVRFGRGLSVAAGATAETALQEGVLQATQEERTITESVTAGVASAILGGTLGALAGSGGKSAKRNLVDGLVEVDRQAKAGSTAGSAYYQPFDPADLRFATTHTGVEHVLGSKGSSMLAAPGVRVAQSPYDTTLETAWRMTDLDVRTEGDMAGKPRPQAAETHIRASTDFELAKQQKASKLLYEQRQDRAMSKEKFWTEVTRANSNGDVHADPSIQQAAKWWRDNVYEPRKVDAQGLGLLPDELAVRGAKGYAPRDFDFHRLSREAGQFQDAVRNYLQGIGVPKDEADELAEHLYSGLMTAPNGRLPQVKLPPGKPAALRERVLNIPDEVLDRWLERDARVLGDRYTRSMVSDIEMTRSFGGLHPEKWLDEQRAKLRDERTAKVAEAEAKGDIKKAQQLAARADEDDKTLQSIFDRVRGTDVHDRDWRTLGSRLAPALRTVGNVTPTTMLGTVAVTSLTDAANLVFQHGLARTMGTVLRQFGNGFAGLRGASKAELQQAGAMLETATSSRRRAVWDAGTSDLTAGRTERASQRLSDQFFRLTLLNEWTDTMSGFAGLMSTQRILDAAETLAKGGKLSKFDMQHLAAAGLGEDMLKRIAQEAQHWQRIPGGRIGNVDAWADREAARMFRGAVAHGSDMAIMRPNAASVPFWVGSAGSRLIYQFKSFASTMVSRTLVSGLQRRDMAAINGIALMTAMGTGVTALKDLINKGEIEERTAGLWVAEAIDKSGVVQYVFEANNALATFGLGFLPTTSRYAEREDLVMHLLGPAAGQGQRVERLVRNALDAVTGEGLTQSDARNATRLLPFGNLWFARQLFDKAIGASGLPEQRGE